MNPRSRHPGAWLVLAILAWEVVYTTPLRQGFFARLHTQAPPLLAGAYVLLMPLLDAAIYVALAERAWSGRRRWRGLPMPDLRGFGLLALGYLAVAGLDYGLFHLFYPTAEPPVGLLSDFLHIYPVCLLAGFLAATINGLERSRAEAAYRAQEAERTALEAQARLVAAQLDPHITFNLLASVEAMAHNEEISDILASAATYLRGVVDATKARTIPLAKEREIIDRFLAVQQVLVGDRLMVEWDWDDRCDEVRVPPLMLQTLVENAVKHGVWPSPGGGLVKVSARRLDQTLALAVVNSGAAPQASSGGTGLANLRDRLHYVYGPMADFTFERRGLWTHAEIILPREA